MRGRTRSLQALRSGPWNWPYLASGAPPCLAGQRDGKFSSEQDSGHDGNLILPGRTVFGIVDSSASRIRIGHRLPHGLDELSIPAPGLRQGPRK